MERNPHDQPRSMALGWISLRAIAALFVAHSAIGAAKASTVAATSGLEEGTGPAGMREHIAHRLSTPIRGDSAAGRVLCILSDAADASVELKVERTGSARSKYPAVVMSTGTVYGLEGEHAAVRLPAGEAIVLRTELLSAPEGDTSSSAPLPSEVDNLLLVRLHRAQRGRALVIVEQTCYGQHDVRRPGGSIPFQRTRRGLGQWELSLDGLQPGEYALVAADQIAKPAGPIALFTFGIGEPYPPSPANNPSH